MLKNHSTSMNLLHTVENAESGRLHIPTLVYSMTTSNDCYNVYTMKSAMEQVATGRKIKYMGGHNIKNLSEFSNEDLNAHFQELFLDLKREEAKGVWGSQGIAIFNIWNVDHSHTV